MKNIIIVFLLTLSALAQVKTPTVVDSYNESQRYTYEKPVHHNFIVRHKYAIYFSGLAIASGIFFYKTWPQHCSNYIDGYPYAGTPPCPKSCDGPGDCYWPGKPGIVRHK